MEHRHNTSVKSGEEGGAWRRANRESGVSAGGGEPYSGREANISGSGVNGGTSSGSGAVINEPNILSSEENENENEILVVSGGELESGESEESEDERVEGVFEEVGEEEDENGLVEFPPAPVYSAEYKVIDSVPGSVKQKFEEHKGKLALCFNRQNYLLPFVNARTSAGQLPFTISLGMQFESNEVGVRMIQVFSCWYGVFAKIKRVRGGTTTFICPNADTQHCSFKVLLHGSRITKCNAVHTCQLQYHQAEGIVTPYLEAKFGMKLMMVVQAVLKESCKSKLSYAEKRSMFMTQSGYYVASSTFNLVMKEIVEAHRHEDGLQYEQMAKLCSLCDFVDIDGVGNVQTLQRSGIEPEPFARAFVANGTVARAFNVATNPVLVCDGTFMENYNGVKLTLLVAVMKTGENHLLPFAVSIVQGESYANWLYFFTGVKRMLQKVGFADWRRLVVVSDGDKGLKKSFDVVLGNLG